MINQMQKYKVPKLGTLYIVVVINLTTTKRSSKSNHQSDDLIPDPAKTKISSKEQSHQNDGSADSAKTNENLAKEQRGQNDPFAKTYCLVSIENINNSTIVICRYFYSKITGLRKIPQT